MWQNLFPHIHGADLVVIGQENRFLINYWLQLLPRHRRPRLALWGHGRNFQARSRRTLRERWKAHWARRADWWFAYTEASRSHIEQLGFPSDRVSVLNNSVDISEVTRARLATTPERLAELRRELGLAGHHVGVFVGGLYPDKRLPFLIEAADRIRGEIPDFELIVVGGGEDLAVVEGLARTRPWIHVTGPQFGQAKVELMLLGQIFLMPGLVGLAILDAGAVGLPLITTDYPWHSPEIAYLEDGENGLIISPWQDVARYAEAVVALLRDPERLARMRAQAEAISQTHSIDDMSDRFVAGVIEALAAS